jgi:2-methylcitrate dehydratase PrpD
VLGLIAVFDRASLADFDAHFQDPRVVTLRRKVQMGLDAEVDGAYPQRWIGKVDVLTTDGRTLHGRVDEPKGDPGNTLSRPEIEAKARQLAAYGGGASAAEMDTLIERAWHLAAWPRVERLLA